VLYEAGAGSPLRGIDNLTVTRAGEIFVCEDGGNMEICVITAERTVAPFLRLTGEAAQGPADRGNELAGVAFSPAGDRMYFSAQRAFGFGATYEVRGPFAGAGAPASAPAPTAPAGPPPRRPRITAARAISVGRLRKPGYAVVVRTTVAGTALAALRTDALGRVPGQRGSVVRPRPVTLAKARKRVLPGRTVLRLAAGPRTTARLRSRRVTRALLTVQVRDAGDRVHVLTRSIKVVRRRER
jgi:hypothetical protein